MADLLAQQYVAVEAIYASRFSPKFNILYTLKQNALGGEGGGGITQIVKSFPFWRT